MRARDALGRLGELLSTLTPNEKRDLVLLFLERVEVRPSGKKPASKHAAGVRFLELRLKLRISRLVEGMAERLVIEERAARAVSASPSRVLALTLELAVAPLTTATSPVTLLAPFRCELGMARRAPTPTPPPAPVLHPIHRARAWQRRLETEAGLTRLALAREEGLAPGSITHHMKLLLLAVEIQTKLLNLTAAADVRRYGLNKMKALAELPCEEQLRQFAEIPSASTSA